MDEGNERRKKGPARTIEGYSQPKQKGKIPGGKETRRNGRRKEGPESGEKET